MGRDAPGLGSQLQRERSLRSPPDFLSRDAHHHRRYPMHETGVYPFRFLHQLDEREALHDLLPEDRQLQLGEPVADAAMNAEAKRQMLSRAGTIDDEAVGIFNRLGITVA